MQVNIRCAVDVELPEDTVLNRRDILDSVATAIENAIHEHEKNGFTHPLEHQIGIKLQGSIRTSIKLSQL